MIDPYYRGIEAIDPRVRTMQREDAEARYKAMHHYMSRADITRKRPAVNIKPLTPDNIK